MATEHQDNDKIEPAPSLTKRGAARRRLAKAGMGAGVLATLESKSAMASMVCRSPSGSLSDGLSTSHYGNTAPACSGMGPDYWLAPKCGWPVSRDLMFSRVFSVTSGGSCPTRYTDTYYAKKTSGAKYYEPGSYGCAKLSDMLNPQSFDTNRVGMHLVTAYLNILQGYVGFLKVEDLQTMWNELQSTGRFSPTASVYWGTAEVAHYLSSIHAPSPYDV
ncbi:hypothetical protein ACL58G_03725 [Massilia sp. GER05]|uniref:hypothetical protein n=1 Tax=unclassified Massilia TaxID=2609279 RepID=UPI0039A4F17A